MPRATSWRGTLPRVRNAKRTVVDGKTFHSKREAARYQELVLEQRAGLIHDLRCQVPFPLRAAGDAIVGHYVADFTYHHEGVLTVEDCKGFRTDLYRWKKRHLKAQTGITILET